jgi:hypothetical protein
LIHGFDVDPMGGENVQPGAAQLARVAGTFWIWRAAASDLSRAPTPTHLARQNHK